MNQDFLPAVNGIHEKFLRWEKEKEGKEGLGLAAKFHKKFIDNKMLDD